MPQSTYHAHHAGWGSYASFIMGKTGCGGGFCLSDVKSPNDNIYLAYRKSGEPVRLFPFYTGKKAGLDQQSYDADVTEYPSSLEQAEGITVDEITLETGWGFNRWSSGPLSFTLYTPFGEVPEIKTPLDQDYKPWLAPVITGEVVLDNTAGEETLTGLFALQNLRRPLSDVSNKMIGGASGRDRGLAARPQAGITEVLDWDILGAAFEGGAFRRLAFDAGFKIEAEPGEKKSLPFVLGTYQEGVLTSGYPCRMLYTALFESLEEVLDYGLEHWQGYREKALERSRELENSGLSADRQFLIAHSTRSYLANTQLLLDEEGRVVFVVNEGEYQMMNTLDLSIDQLFWEGKYSPWVTRNILDLFSRRYLYQDRLKGDDGEYATFTHDMGVANMFSPQGLSSYELPNLSGCFSFMSAEELLNWILTAGCYGLKQEDIPWLTEQKPLISRLESSLAARDRDKDGIMDIDSSFCGEGSEITTYDSLDVSLGQARRNLYLAVKAWSAWVVLAALYRHYQDSEAVERCEQRALAAADTLTGFFDEKAEFIPAVFEQNNRSQIIPAVEGLIYPAYIGDADAVSEKGRFGKLIGVLKRHIRTVLKPGVCIDPVSGGWKLSSTSRNTWMSKIFINQYVVQTLLEMDDYPWEEWDAVHTGWQQGLSGLYAATDQVCSSDGSSLGSRNYPRLVSSILWYPGAVD